MADILVAEDDTNIRTGLVSVLESECHRVRVAKNGLAALTAYEKKRPDLLLLDVMMPHKSGYDVCAEIRRIDQKLPILMLTAKSEEVDKILGLGLGADDYITKPFSVKELIARVSVALRRVQAFSEPHIDSDEFKFSSFIVDAKGYTMTDSSGLKSPLSPREVTLLKLFATHPDETLTREILMNQLWGVSYYGTTRTLDQHIAQLRRKLGKAGESIVTVQRVGYRYTGKV